MSFGRKRADAGLRALAAVVLLAALVLPAMGLLSAARAAAGIVAGEVTALTSIVFLGKEGFMAIKARIFGAIRAEFERPVGRTRHTIGIILRAHIEPPYGQEHAAPVCLARTGT